MLKKQKAAKELGLPRPWARYESWNWADLWDYAHLLFPVSTEQFILEHNPPEVPDAILRAAQEYKILIELERRRSENAT